MRILWVAGSRDYDNEPFMRLVLRPYAEAGWVLVTGGARGADLMAEDLWRSWECAYIGEPAKWRTEGRRAAGPKRNRRIPALWKPELLIHFPGGRGTADAIIAARSAGIEVMPARA